MKRDLRKAVEDYRKKYYNSNSQEGQFYYSDIVQLKEMAEEGAKGNYSEILYNAIGCSLQAGFMIGYKKAVRDAKNRKKHNM